MNNNEIVQLVQLICLLVIMIISFLIGIAIGWKIAQLKKKDKEENGNQKPDIDKIRSEIEYLRLNKVLFRTWDNKRYIDSQAVLDVIDKYKDTKCRGASMTVAEVIALLCKQASDEDKLLMAKDIYSIEVNDEGILLSFVDENTEIYY